MLQGKHIVLGVCGGIAAYKAADLTSKLQQAGALGDGVLTERAAEIVRPPPLSPFSPRPPYARPLGPTGEPPPRPGSAPRLPGGGGGGEGRHVVAPGGAPRDPAVRVPSPGTPPGGRMAFAPGEEGGDRGAGGLRVGGGVWGAAPAGIELRH